MYLNLEIFTHLTMLSGSSSHGIVHLQVEDGVHSLQVWWLVADVLNKQSWTTNKGVDLQLWGWVEN